MLAHGLGSPGWWLIRTGRSRKEFQASKPVTQNIHDNLDTDDKESVDNTISKLEEVAKETAEVAVTADESSDDVATSEEVAKDVKEETTEA